MKMTGEFLFIDECLYWINYALACNDKNLQSYAQNKLIMDVQG